MLGLVFVILVAGGEDEARLFFAASGFLALLRLFSGAFAALVGALAATALPGLLLCRSARRLLVPTGIGLVPVPPLPSSPASGAA